LGSRSLTRKNCCQRYLHIEKTKALPGSQTEHENRPRAWHRNSKLQEDRGNQAQAQQAGDETDGKYRPTRAAEMRAGIEENSREVERLSTQTEERAGEN
jgi:hypothetical protein